MQIMLEEDLAVSVGLRCARCFDTISHVTKWLRGNWAVSHKTDASNSCLSLIIWIFVWWCGFLFLSKRANDKRDAFEICLVEVCPHLLPLASKQPLIYFHTTWVTVQLLMRNILHAKLVLDFNVYWLACCFYPLAAASSPPLSDFLPPTLAPSQAPVKIMWNTSNSKVILHWDQVHALDNESEVTGYKVMRVKPCTLPMRE